MNYRITKASDIIEQALETALWCTTDYNGEPLDDNYNIDDIEQETIQQLTLELKDFITANQAIIDKLPEHYSTTDLAHDFVLTRNGHGAGFWDRGLGHIGDLLTEACKPYGPFELYETGNNTLAAE